MGAGQEARAAGNRAHDEFVDALEVRAVRAETDLADTLASLGQANQQTAAERAAREALVAEFDAYKATHPDPPPPPVAPKFQRAVQFHAVWERTGPTFGATHVDILTKLKAAGINTVRIDTSWRSWEPTRGVFPARIYNGKLDDTLNWMRDQGMRALVTVNESPVWAASGALRRLPDSPGVCEGIGRHTTEHLAQWGDTIVGVEFWNEPNLRDFEDLGPRPAHYADCLTAFHRGAKAGRGAQVPIVFGATEAICVAPVGQLPTRPREHFVTYVYEHLAKTGGRPWDVMAVHCYPGNEPVELASTGSQFWRPRHLDHLFATMDAHGDPSDVFITEFGWSAHANTTLGTSPQPPWQVGVTEEQQAKLTADFFAYVAANYPRVKLAVLYNDWEKGNPATATTYAARHQHGFGILRHADRATTKPIYAALKET